MASVRGWARFHSALPLARTDGVPAPHARREATKRDGASLRAAGGNAGTHTHGTKTGSKPAGRRIDGRMMGRAGGRAAGAGDLLERLDLAEEAHNSDGPKHPDLPVCAAAAGMARSTRIWTRIRAG